MTDPLARFREWQEEAVAAGVTLPEAMTLATADESGRPAARTVLLKGVDERGFVFFTNYESRKGRQLAANPRAALTFLWHTEPRRQVLVTGTVEKVPRAEPWHKCVSRQRSSEHGISQFRGADGLERVVTGRLIDQAEWASETQSKALEIQSGDCFSRCNRSDQSVGQVPKKNRMAFA